VCTEGSNYDCKLTVDGEDRWYISYLRCDVKIPYSDDVPVDQSPEYVFYTRNDEGLNPLYYQYHGWLGLVGLETDSVGDSVGGPDPDSKGYWHGCPQGYFVTSICNGGELWDCLLKLGISVDGQFGFRTVTRCTFAGKNVAGGYITDDVPGGWCSADTDVHYPTTSATKYPNGIPCTLMPSSTWGGPDDTAAIVGQPKIWKGHHMFSSYGKYGELVSADSERVAGAAYLLNYVCGSGGSACATMVLKKVIFITQWRHLSRSRPT
jgi:hypothetical protein